MTDWDSSKKPSVPTAEAGTEATEKTLTYPYRWAKALLFVVGFAGLSVVSFLEADLLGGRWIVAAVSAVVLPGVLYVAWVTLRTVRVTKTAIEDLYPFGIRRKIPFCDVETLRPRSLLDRVRVESNDGTTISLDANLDGIHTAMRSLRVRCPEVWASFLSVSMIGRSWLSAVSIWGCADAGAVSLGYALDAGAPAWGLVALAFGIGAATVFLRAPSQIRFTDSAFIVEYPIRSHEIPYDSITHLDFHQRQYGGNAYGPVYLRLRVEGGRVLRVRHVDAPLLQVYEALSERRVW
jgi:hypothetical protein